MLPKGGKGMLYVVLLLLCCITTVVVHARFM